MYGIDRGFDQYHTSYYTQCVNRRKNNQLKSILESEVLVDPLRLILGVSQCFKCQKFGHTQSCCTVTITCVACGEEHFPSEYSGPGDQSVELQSHPANQKNCSWFCGRESWDCRPVRTLEAIVARLTLHSPGLLNIWSIYSYPSRDFVVGDQGRVFSGAVPTFAV